MKSVELFATVAAVGLIAGFAPAYAQSTTVEQAQSTTTGSATNSPTTTEPGTPAAPTSTVPTAPAAAAATTGTGEIVVVGSRIRRDAFDSASPITVITREEQTLAGFTSTSQTLQSGQVTGGTAQINNAFGGFVTNGGPGANTLSLRGLGAERTLILLNGRRIAPAGTRGSVGSADLNVLPNAIIDRIDILKDGASSIYGSDAVAGVVNIVTKTKINGLTLEAQYAPTWDGGGDVQRYSVTAGYTGDRFQLSGSLEYYKRDGLSLADRDWTQCNTDYRRTAANRTPGSGDFIDPRTGQPKCYPITSTGSNGVTINTIGTNTSPGVGAPGSVGTNFNRFRPNAAVTTGAFPGFEGVGGGANNLNVRDTFDPRTLNRSLISPAKVYTGFFQGSYDLQTLGDAEVYAEVLLNRRKSSQVGYRQLSLDYAIGSPLIPANLAASRFSLVPVAPQLTQPGVGIGVRAFIGFGNDTNSQRSDFVKVSGGVRGDFFFPGFRYDLYGSYSKADASYTFQSFITSKLRQSLDVVSTGPGTFACRNPANGCVAAPALTSDVIGGRLPTNWVNYVFVPVTGTTKYQETVVAFNVDGSVFSLPYGDVKIALGAEYRFDKLNDTPPIESQTGDLFNLTSAVPTRGSDAVKEVFGEVEVPLLRNLPFAQNLTLNASARFTDYRSYGSDVTYKFGGIFTPVDFLSLRATYGTSYRAPAIFEQYLGATSGFLSQSGDPCNNFDAPGVSPVRRANCASEGLPAAFNATTGITVLTAGGAGAGLKAETSKNFTVGAILQPKFGAGFGDLSFAVDYYNIEVSNGVSRAGAANILQLCYDDPQFRAGGGFCRLVNPRAAGSFGLTVNDSYVNLSTDLVRGLDYTVRYARDLGPGRLRLTGQITQYLKQASKLFSDDPLDDINGNVAAPKFTGTLDATYTYNEFTFRYGLEWIDGTSSYDYYGLDPATTGFLLETPDYFTHSASVRYRGDKFEVTAGVRNFTDKRPPQISSGVYNRIGNAPLYSGYDYVGRSLFINVSKSF